MERKGYHPIINPFFNASFGVDNHIYNTPTDLMHLFLCGLIKSVLQWTLIIIGEINHHVGDTNNKDYTYTHNKGLLIKDFGHFHTFLMFLIYIGILLEVV